MKEVVKKLIGKLIISCQAYEDTPLYGSHYMKAMAECALMGGAEAIRSCWPQDIRAIRELGDFPIVGLNKVIDPSHEDDNYIIITPTLEAASAVIDAGCDIVAIDCTIRDCRGKEELYDLLKSIKEKYPDIAIMADCATLEDCIFAEQTGMVDILATTLSGLFKPLNGPDIELVKQIKKHCKLPVNAEGSVWELKDVKDLIDAGADMICIGTAITRPHLITKRFIDYNKEVRG